MSATSLAEIVMRLLLLLAGLVLPGTMILRALRLPASLAGAFAGSAAVLYLLVIGFDLAGITVSLSSLTVGLAATALGARLIPVRGRPDEAPPWHACVSRLGGWTVFAAFFWLVVGWRLATQPLSGPDVHFRWSWLAEQLVRFGSLEFYPARSAGDFARYFWPESIPPGVASLHAWAYLCGGQPTALWTSPVVALQLLALHDLLWRLGHQWGGEVVARRAVLLAAATPLLGWSVLIGQETGLTALAACGLAWTLPRLREADGPRWAVLAGLLALLAASAREYGPAYAATAVLLAAVIGAPRRSLLVLSLVALPAASLWPLRTWVLTGNPFYSLDVAGLFPVNDEFIAWQKVFHAPHADPLATAAAWQGLGRYLVLWALPAVLGLGALLALLGRRQAGARVPAMLVLLTLALWWASLPYTAGGLFYSLRVLSPALALLVVPAAYALTTWAPVRIARVVPFVLALLAAESLPKTLVLPQNPYRLDVAGWPDAGGEFSAGMSQREHALRNTLRSLPPASRVVADTPSFQRAFASLGVTVIPPWSPEFAWVFDATLPPDEFVRRWRASGLHRLVLGRSPSGAGFVLPRVRWPSPPIGPHTIAETEDNLVIEITNTSP